MLINPVERYCLNKGREQGKKEGIEEGLKKGIKEGKFDAKIEMAKRLLNDGHPIGYVSKISSLPLNTIKIIKIE
ncbi:MAG: hypothetical protein E7Z78_06830 [Methanobrevibacter thaueri]|jgi:predicted transposase/invertase (TIGR01784 family)|uniref:hypothetical protein n=1 Tax=Methanobrevibacter thaueri TaxID=190975 RepID=UPI0026F353EF|nr:hypothetical protein [Methanobrevibacter thaueri]MBE6496145.1 hypothetical protein [Methanobrevibacter thaueri]